MMRFRPILSHCAAMTVATATPAFAQTAEPWAFKDAAAKLRAASCPDRDPAMTAFMALDATVEAVRLGAPDAVAAQLPGRVRFAGGWVFDAPGPEFGGLSGLAAGPEGDLLAVGDTGRFVRIGMEDGAPDGRLSTAPMRFETPLVKPGKLTADAEGLDYRGGLAFVSFERNFRVLAFDLGRCGANATGVTVANPPGRYGWTRVRANAGPEALWLDATGTMRIAYEQPRDGRAVTGTVLSDGTVGLSDPATDPALDPGYRPVGADSTTLSDGRTVTARLFRAYDRDRGNRVRLDIEGLRGDPLVSLRLAPPLATDNFEGVALVEAEDALRVFLLSDDNFSDRQRTLLYRFDIAR
ncbi:esterase-like activity of phytase family protein [uncultured Algimonas sp.]|uniref:esterase-like activity of phytase family protein n=1 Tax=uncultured Algimonas sp. TaxID=1547920 RepID=UPI0026385FE4|nr:esterase-like activity of phytase family protein [uncultured Algimonas sp.]